jgi:hypothetical protein
VQVLRALPAVLGKGFDLPSPQEALEQQGIVPVVDQCLEVGRDIGLLDFSVGRESCPLRLCASPAVLESLYRMLWLETSRSV